MIGRLNHVAIAVKSLEASAAIYRGTLGAKVSDVDTLPEHGVKVVFVELPNTKIELLEPLGITSPIAKFLEKNPDGGIHHVCYEVDDIIAARDKLKAEGARVLGSAPTASLCCSCIPKTSAARWSSWSRREPSCDSALMFLKCSCTLFVNDGGRNDSRSA